VATQRRLGSVRSSATQRATTATANRHTTPSSRVLADWNNALSKPVHGHYVSRIPSRQESDLAACESLRPRNGSARPDTLSGLKLYPEIFR
jgi:hypothetical protein